MKINLSSYVVCSNGVVDLDATLAKFQEDLTDFAASEKAEHDMLSKAVDTVLDKHNGQVTKDLLVFLVAQELGASSDSWSSLKPKLTAFLSDKTKFKSVKGVGGGISRV